MIGDSDRESETAIAATTKAPQNIIYNTLLLSSNVVCSFICDFLMFCSVTDCHASWIDFGHIFRLQDGSLFMWRALVKRHYAKWAVGDLWWWWCCLTKMLIFVFLVCGTTAAPRGSGFGAWGATVIFHEHQNSWGDFMLSFRSPHTWALRCHILGDSVWFRV